MRALWLAAATAFVSVGQTWAQAPLVPLRWQAEAGKSAAFELRAEVSIRQTENEGSAHVVEIKQGARVEVRFEEVGDDGSASASARFSRVSLAWRDGDARGEWRQGEGAGEGDVSRALAAMGEAVVGTEVRLTVDGEGAITGISGMEEIRAALGGEGGLGESALGVFAEMAMASGLAPVFQGDAAGAGDALRGAGARRVGSAWETSEQIGLGAAGALEVTATWSLKSVESGVARIEGEWRVEALAPEEPSPGAPSVRVEAATGAGVTEWDLTAGVLRSREIRQSLTMAWTLGDLTLRQEQTSVLALRRAE